ncbi:hypothetical protein BP5796_07521 [Coleophoma crateriformis]|uniref:Involucrin repeat protein n=1 Tax=Coleophoma crateriformis TaxID=565419 RepID=A0A3D8RJ51_9HELO|nr:hypothetical protein BP5796_07521 [Coleophoma crateriformis]
MADRSRRSPEGSVRRRKEYTRAEYDERQRMRSRNDSISLSSSSSSSYIDISRTFPRNRIGGVIKTFFSTPSEHRRRLRRRRSGRLASHSNSSSSSINSDLAYGTGFLKKPKHRHARSRKGKERETGRESDRERERPGLGRRAATDAEIIAVGAGLAALAKKQNDMDLRHARDGKTSEIYMSKETRESRIRGESGPSRGLLPSKVSYGSDTFDEDGWESASDAESEYSVDSKLAYGSVVNASVWGPTPRPPQPRRTDSIVDPRLFGPNNSLHGLVTEPVGFQDVDIHYHSDFGQSPEVPLPHPESNSSTTNITLQQVFPIGTSDPSRFEAGRGSVVSSRPEGYVSRPAPIPIQQPQPVTPVSQSVYEPVYATRSESGGILKKSSSSSGRGKSLAEAALAGVAGAAIGAALSSDRKSDRGDKSRVDDDTPSRRKSGSSKSDSGKEERRRDKRGSPDREDRKERRREKERELEREKEREEESRRDKKREKRRDETREETKEERRERRREERRGERRIGEEPRSKSEISSSEISRTVDPFQFQVADDAFPTPDIDGAIQFSTPRRHESVPTVVTVDREPDFARNHSSSIRERPVGVRSDSGRDYADRDVRDTRYTRSEVHDERRTLEDAKHFYEETEHSTAPIAAAAMGAAVAAVAMEGYRESRSERRRGERRGEYDEYDSKSRVTESQESARDKVQEEADRAYREIVMARKIASNVIRSRTPSPDASIVDKYASKDEEPEVIQIVTPPEMEHHKKKGPYDAPNADCEIDQVLTPKDFENFTSPTRENADFSYFSRDYRMSKDRPLLNLVQPTPIPSPLPEMQEPRNEPSQSQPKKSKYDRDVQSEVAQSTQPKADKYESRSDVGQPGRYEDRGRGRSMPSYEPEVTQSPTASTISKAVTWGENETKHFEVESPSHSPVRSRDQAEEPRPSSSNSKSTGWGAIAAGIIGAGAAAAVANGNDTNFKSKPQENGHDKTGSYEYRGIVVEPESPPRSSERRSPPATGPKPISSQSSHIPGAFEDDLDFTATLAAGLQDTGFDPNIVINDPTYRRRTSPPGSNGPETESQGYKAPFAETVTDLGVFQVDSPGHEGALPVQGFVVGEVPDTPRDESAGQGEFDEWPTKLSKKEQKKRDKAAKRLSGDVNPLDEIPTTKEIVKEPEEYFESKLSKKDQKKRDKEAKRQSILAEEATPSEEPTSTRSLVEEPESYFETPKKSKKKSKKGSSYDDYEDDQRDSRSTVSVPVDAYKDVLNEETPVITSAVDDWDTPKKSKKKSKRDSDRFDSPSHSRPSSEVGSELERSSSKKSKDKSKRRSEQYDVDPTEIPLPMVTPSEFSRDDYDDRKTRRSNRDSGIFDSTDRGESRSVVSAGASRYDDDETRKSKKKHRSSRDDDDAKSIASAPAGDEWEDSKKSKKKDKKSGSGFFGLFGSKSEPEPKESSKDEWDEPKKKKKSKRSSTIDSSSDIYSGNGHANGTGSRISLGNGDGNGYRSDEDQRKRDSFLANPGTLGAGVGLAGAALAIAAQHQHSNAATADRELAEATNPAVSDLPFRQRAQDDRILSSTLETFDPEITERDFRPSIDPQYGDLLPLPPSSPPSPDIDSTENLPELPESRPATPEEQRRPTRDKSARRSMYETPMKSPSHSAVPLNFVMRNRSIPTSPVLGRASPSASPATSNQDILSAHRSRPRPTSWDSTKEFKPLYLVESNRRPSINQQTEPDEPLPELPPSTRSSRSSSQLEVDGTTKAGPQDQATESSENPVTGPLSINTSVSASEFLGSQESTPRAKNISQSIDGALENSQMSPSKEPLDDSRPIESSLEQSNEDTGKEAAIAGAVGAITLASSLGYFASTPASKATNDSWVESLPSYAAQPQEPSPIDPMTKDRSSYLLNSSPPSNFGLETHALPQIEEPEIGDIHDTSEGLGLGVHRSPELEPSYSVDASNDIDPSKDNIFEPPSLSQAVTMVGIEDQETIGAEPKDDLDEFPLTKSKKDKKKDKKKNKLSRSSTQEDFSLPQSSEETATNILPAADDFSSFETKKSKKKKGKSNFDWEQEPGPEPVSELVVEAEPELPPNSSAKEADAIETATFDTPLKKSKKKKGKSNLDWEPESEITPEPESVPEPAEMGFGPTEPVEELQQEPEPQPEPEPEQLVTSSSKKSKKSKKGKASLDWEPESEAVSQPEPILAPETTHKEVGTLEAIEESQPAVETEQFITSSKKNKKKKAKSNFDWEPEPEVESKHEPESAAESSEKAVETFDTGADPEPEQVLTPTTSKKNKKKKGKSTVDWEPEPEAESKPVPELEIAPEPNEKGIEVVKAREDIQPEPAHEAAEKDIQDKEAVDNPEPEPASEFTERGVEEATSEQPTTSSKKSKKKKGNPSSDWEPEPELASQSLENAIDPNEEFEQFVTPTSSKKSKKKKNKSISNWEPEPEEMPLETAEATVVAEALEKEVNLTSITNETDPLHTPEFKSMPIQQEGNIAPSAQGPTEPVLNADIEQNMESKPEVELQPVHVETKPISNEQSELIPKDQGDDTTAGDETMPQSKEKVIDVQPEPVEDFEEFSTPVSRKGKENKGTSNLDWTVEPETILESVDKDVGGVATSEEMEQFTMPTSKKNKKKKGKALLDWEPEPEAQLESTLAEPTPEPPVLDDAVAKNVEIVETTEEPEQFTKSTSKKNKKKKGKATLDWEPEPESQLQSLPQVEPQAEPKASESLNSTPAIGLEPQPESQLSSESQPKPEHELPRSLEKDVYAIQEPEEITMSSTKKNKKKKGKSTFDWEPEPESQPEPQVEPAANGPAEATEMGVEGSETVNEAAEYITTSSKKSKKKGKKTKAWEIEDEPAADAITEQPQIEEPETYVVAGSKKSKKKSKKAQNLEPDNQTPDEPLAEPEPLESAPLPGSDLSKEQIPSPDGPPVDQQPSPSIVTPGELGAPSTSATTPWFTATEEPAGSSGVDYFPPANDSNISLSRQDPEDAEKDNTISTEAIPITAVTDVASDIHEPHTEDGLEQESAKSTDNKLVDSTKSGLDVGFSEEQLRLAKQMQEEFSAGSKKSKKDKKKRQSSLPPASEFEEPRARHLDDVKDDHPRSRSLSADPANVAGASIGSERKPLYSDEQLELARQLKAEQESGGKKSKKDKKKRSGLSRSSTYDDFAQEYPEEELPVETAELVTATPDLEINEGPKPDGFAAGYQEDQLSLARQLQAEFGSASGKKSKKERNRRSTSQTPIEEREPASDYFGDTQPTLTLVGDRDPERQATPDQTGKDTPDGLTAGYREEQLELARQLKEEFGSGSKKSKKGKKRDSLLRTATEDDFSSENFVTPMEEPPELYIDQGDASQAQTPNPDEEFAFSTKKSKKGKKGQSLSEAVSEKFAAQEKAAQDQDEQVAVEGSAAENAEAEFSVPSTKKSKKDKKRQSLLRHATEDDFSSDYPAKESEEFSGPATPVEATPAEEFISPSKKSKKDKKDKKRQSLLRSTNEDDFSSDNPAKEAEDFPPEQATLETAPTEEPAISTNKSKKDKKRQSLMDDEPKEEIVLDSASKAFDESRAAESALEPSAIETSTDPIAANAEDEFALPPKKSKKNKKNRQSQLLDTTDEIGSDSAAVEPVSEQPFVGIPDSMDKGPEENVAYQEDEFAPVSKKKSKKDKKRQSLVPADDPPAEVLNESRDLEHLETSEQAIESAVVVSTDDFPPVSKKKSKKDKKRQSLALDDDMSSQIVTEAQEVTPAADPETPGRGHEEPADDSNKRAIANPEDKFASVPETSSQTDRKDQSLSPTDDTAGVDFDTQEPEVSSTGLPKPTEEIIEATTAAPEDEFAFMPKKSKKNKKKGKLAAIQDDTTDVSPTYVSMVDELENSKTLPAETTLDDFEYSSKKSTKSKKKQNVVSIDEDPVEEVATDVNPANDIAQEAVDKIESTNLENTPDAEEEFQFTSKKSKKGKKNRNSILDSSSFNDSSDAVVDKSEAPVDDEKALNDESITVVEQDEELGFSTKKSKKDKKKRQSLQQTATFDSAAVITPTDEVVQSDSFKLSEGKDVTMDNQSEEFEYSTKKSKKDKKKRQSLLTSDPSAILPVETGTAEPLSLEPESMEAEAAREQGRSGVAAAEELPDEANNPEELAVTTGADTSDAAFDSFGRKLSKKDKKKRKESLKADLTSSSWADEMEAHVSKDTEKGVEIGEQSIYDQVLDKVEPPVDDFSKPNKKGKKGKKNQGWDDSMATAGVLAPTTETESPREVEDVLVTTREPVQTSHGDLVRKSTEPEEDPSKHLGLATTGIALAATALIEAKEKQADLQVSDAKSFVEPKTPEATTGTPTRKLSKKEKRKKNLDKRTPREDDIFDDPVLWEGKDPKSHEEIQAGDNDGSDDGFWSPPKREEEVQLYEEPISMTEPSHDHDPAQASTPPESVQEPLALVPAISNDEQATGTDRNISKDIQENTNNTEQEVFPKVAEESSVETPSKQFDDNSDVLTRSSSKKDKKKKNRVAELYMSLEEHSSRPAETSNKAKKDNRISEIYQPLERLSSEPTDLVEQKKHNRSAEVYTPFEEKASGAEPAKDTSLTQIPVIVRDVAVDSPSLSSSPIPPLSASKFRQSGSFGLPILPEELEPRKLDRDPPGLGTPDINRDSAFVTESPTPYHRGKLHDQEPLRDSGVHLRDYSPGGKRRSVASTDDAIARLSWPSVDEDTETVDLFHSQRSKAERAITPSRDIQPPQKLKESKYGDLRSVKPLADKTKPFNDGIIGTGTVAARVAAMQSPGQSYSSREQQRPSSGQSQRSASNINRMRTPDPKITRPESVSSNRSTASSTHSLRRTDRRFSGDLRSLSQRSKLDLAKEAELAAITATSITAASNVIANNSTPSANEGRVRAKDKDMADVYDGFGEGRLGSPRSPTRPHSMRRRQSMQVLDLETRLEQLSAENQALAEAKEVAERTLQTTQHAAASLADRDSEIDSLKASLDWLHREVNRLTEVNEGLTSANVTLGNQYNDRYGLLETQHSQATRELQEIRAAHNNLAVGNTEVQTSLAAKDEEIAQLRSELEAAKERIRTMQREILASKANDSEFLVVRDEDYFDVACQQLCQHVQQWVLRFSKFSDMRACRLTREINNDKIIDRLDNAILDGSDVDDYLADRVKRRDVFMSMTMTMVWEFIFTRYLFGMDREQRQKLKSLEKLLLEVGPPAAVHLWRATTLTLLAKRQAFLQQREQDTEAVVNEILNTLFEILPPPSQLEDQIGQQLRRVMKAAVDLSIEMRTQRAEYMMLPPLQPEYDANGELASKVIFNAALMNERSGDTVSNEDLEAQKAVVRVVLFPLVVKKGDDRGDGDEEIVVCPAQVLVAKAKKTGTGSHDNRSRVSMQSNMPAAEYTDGMENSI